MVLSLLLVLAWCTGLTDEPQVPKTREELKLKTKPTEPKPKLGRVGKVQKDTRGKGVVRYRPPRLNAPKVSTGPGTRGKEGEALVLSLFAPEHVGLTVEDQPSLYWFQSRQTDRPVEVTLVVPGVSEPVLEVVYPKAPVGQIQRLSLKQHGVRLEVGKRYRWSVAVVMDADQRSADLLVSGVIERVTRKGLTLGDSIDALPAWDQAVIYADNGLWFDAVAALDDLKGAGKWMGWEALAGQVDAKVLRAYCRSRVTSDKEKR